MADFLFYEPGGEGALVRNPLNAVVGPRPIGWISTQSAAGVRNLAPYSFFNALNYAPPLIGLFFFHGMSGNFWSTFTGGGLGLAISSSGSDAGAGALPGGAMFPFHEAMRACKP